MEKRIPFERSSVVGVIHTLAGFSEAAELALDAVELRLDVLRFSVSLQQLAGLSVPIILTVRTLEEGGAMPISHEEQHDLYCALLPAAAAVDVDMHSARGLRKMLGAAREEEKALIVSFHDFEATPSLSRLRKISAKARNLGADIVKVATRTETAAEISRLLLLLEETTSPLAVMGMGPLGRASRLLFAKAGSVLNYGWLDRAQVPGQWSAREFLELLTRAC